MRSARRGAAVTIPPHLIQHTSRSRKLRRLRAYYDGTQYDGMPDFWTGVAANGETVPMRERAPSVNYRLARNAVNEAVKFSLGEGRFPRIRVEPEEQAYPGLTLSAAEAKRLSVFIGKLAEHALLQPAWSEALAHGLSTGTAVEIVSLRDGCFHSETIRAEHCEPKFSASGEVESVTVCYQYTVTEHIGGQLIDRLYHYRRDIDSMRDVTYKPVLVEGPTQTPEWTVDVETLHEFGFCPVNWARNGRRSGCADVDGVSIYDGDEDEIDALNRALSQRDRGINYWGCPQPWETGVSDGAGPAATTRIARAPKRDDSAKREAYFSPHDAPARRGGVDEVWSYESHETRLGLLETTGTAFEAATKHVNDLRGRLTESMSVVLPDHATIAAKGNVTARLLTLMYAPLLGLVDRIRESWWPGFFCRSLSMRLRMIAQLGQTATILVPGSSEIAPILARFLIDGRWLAPTMKPLWGAYFSPSSAETVESVKAAADALTAGLISRRTACEYVADDFGVQDVDEELASVESEHDDAESTTPEADAEPADVATEPDAADAAQPPR